jgi:phage gpG-like protein
MLDDVDVSSVVKFEKTMRIKMLQLSLDLQNQLRNKVIENIGKTFGNKTKASSGYKSGRSGNLKNSVQVMQKSDFAWKLTVGSAQVPYAAIHEYGGEIRPKKAKWLTIPMDDAAIGHYAREFENLTFVLSKKKEGTAYLFSDAHLLMYLLVKKVRMPKRPYIQPACDEIFSDTNIQRTISKVWKV